jgi:hypothetical protein
MSWYRHHTGKPTEPSDHAKQYPPETIVHIRLEALIVSVESGELRVELMQLGIDISGRGQVSRSTRRRCMVRVRLRSKGCIWLGVDGSKTDKKSVVARLTIVTNIRSVITDMRGVYFEIFFVKFCT